MLAELELARRARAAAAAAAQTGGSPAAPTAHTVALLESPSPAAPPPAAASLDAAAPAAAQDHGAVRMLIDFGFDADSAARALEECDGNFEAALDSLTSGGGVDGGGGEGIVGGAGATGNMGASPSAPAVDYAAPPTAAPADPPPPSSIISHEDVECPVCRSLLHEPLCTACGHTFCRACLATALTIAPLCPICRAPCHVDAARAVANFVIAAVARAAFPAEAASRVAAAVSDAEAMRSANLGLFFLSNASLLPGAPVELVVYETRYHLLIDRCLENNALFGISRGPSDTFGTSVRILSTAILPMGRRAVIARAVGRFRTHAPPTAEVGTGDLHYARVLFIDDDPLDGMPATRRAEDVIAPRRVENDPLPPAPLNPIDAAADSLLSATVRFFDLTEAQAATLLREAVVTTALRLLVDVGHERAGAVIARAGQPPASSATAATAEAWSFWLANALALRRSERSSALSTTSSLTRLSFVFRALVRARPAPRRGTADPSKEPDSFDAALTPAENLARALEPVRADFAFAIFAPPEHSANDEDLRDLCIERCGACARVGFPLAVLSRRLIRFLSDSVVTNLVILVVVMWAIYSSRRGGYY